MVATVEGKTRIFHGALSEEDWNTFGDRFINGETMTSLCTEYGVNPSTAIYRSKRHYWKERKQSKRMGLTWNGPSSGPDSVQAPVMPETNELGEAIQLRKKHDRAYYARLDKILERLEYIEELLLSEADAMKLDYLSKTYERLMERYRILAGKPLPPVIKASEPKKQIQAPSAPIDA